MSKVLAISYIIFLIATGWIFSIDQHPSGMPDNESHIPENRINTLTSFKAVIPQETYVFMLGNNRYSHESGYDNLAQCHNDVRLLKKIFMYCSKVPEKNIFTHLDVTLPGAQRLFEQFLKSIDKKSLVIIFYSGHGDPDGSLVFVDGKKLHPVNLRRQINSFSNDTVLLIDACYSGNNEGPLDFFQAEQPFKSNCIRIYSSLAHLTAKEISYDNFFFKSALPFYREVLGINTIEGNGYFTALLGQFFAHYRLKKRENVSYSKLISHMTNKGKIYTETLAKTGELQKSAWEEAVYRLNQLPKIHPVDEQVSFINPAHEHILLQKKENKYQPDKNFLSVGIETGLPVTMPPYNKSLGLRIMPLISLLYYYSFRWGVVGFGFQAGIQWGSTLPRVKYDYDLLIYPLTLTCTYCTNLPIPLFFYYEVSPGVGINHLLFAGYPEGNILAAKFYLGTGCGIGCNLTKKISMGLGVQYIILIPYDDLFHLLSPHIDIDYYF
jgi:hypothetical protein